MYNHFSFSASSPQSLILTLPGSTAHEDKA